MQKDTISIFLGLSVITDKSQLDFIYSTTHKESDAINTSFNLGKKFSPEHKQNMSIARKAKIWIYNPNTLEERWINADLLSDYTGFKRGRSPKTKHGGKRGAYTKERFQKSGISKWIAENGNPMKGKKHTDATKKKMSAKRKQWHKQND